jgi:DHA1 family bicyclomycin/chloramphenicol resistance-like MFS transporter
MQPQRKLGAVGLIALLVVFSLMTPISLDMYTPAIPHMAEHFAATADTVNLTMVGFFFFFALGLLLFGPLSDRYGRKKLLIVGIVAYTVGSALCALAPTIEFLITTRIVQALGAGAVSAVATAVVKDAVVPEKREMVLSVIQVMFVVGPVLAPVIGALILQFADWRMTFWLLTGVGACCALLSLLFEETLPASLRYTGSIRGSVQHFGAVVKHKGFISFLCIVSLFEIPFMAYIAVGSYVYISFFGLTELEYSYFFAATALFSVTGPFIWLKASRHISARRFTTILFVIALASGVALLSTGGLSPLLFCLLFMVFAVAGACVRPYSTNILLSQHNSDAGAASSVINFTHTAIGCIGMVLAVLPWTNYVTGIGVIIIAIMALACILWFAFLRSAIELPGLKDADPRRPAHESALLAHSAHSPSER